MKLSRINIIRPNDAAKTADALYDDLSRRLQAAPVGNCPVEMTEAFVRLSLSQSCGKCVPCRVGLACIAGLLTKVLDGRASMRDLTTLEETARTLADSADCAIGFDAAKFVIDGLAAFRDDYLSHIKDGRCSAKFTAIPCVSACPANVDIPAYIALTGEGRYADAIRVIRRTNPFPSVCGLICEHPCEARCRREMIDAPINIRGIKRYAVDMAGTVDTPKPLADSGKKIAVVGGGPSGLTAAYFLRLMGHSVTVYEQRKRLGGMLRYGIPCYRLPDDYLDRDIDAILSTGIEVHTEVSIGKDLTLEKLRSENDAVYLAIGAHAASKLGVEGENGRGVMSAVELLRGIGDGKLPDFTGKRVAIVGGGNVAMDVTRTSMRLGAKSVTCTYRRRIEDMTALPEEIEGAMAEGCEMLQLMAPVRIELDEEENVKALILQKQVIGPVSRGRPAPRKADAPETRLECDIVIVAIGQSIDSDTLAEEGVPTKRGKLLADSSTALKGVDGVFSGGDCVAGPETVIRAIEAGQVAANKIDAYLGGSGAKGEDIVIPPASYRFTPPCGRIVMTEREAGERKDDFELMENGMSAEEARQECSRCLRCDHYGYAAFRGGKRE